jgi:N-acetylmuramic acid 6-phosphate (MurNAc-6-P) etherase
MEKMFEIAARQKIRFPFKGLISVEDLWDLSLENLDSIYKVLNSQLKQVKEESLLQVRNAQDKELDVKIEIIKYIVQIKQQEAQARLKAKERKEKNAKIMEIIATKKDQDMQNKSIAELEAMLNEED